MKIIFYPLDYQYKVKDEQVLIYLYGKTQEIASQEQKNTPQSQKIVITFPYQPYFYAKLNNSIDKGDSNRKNIADYFQKINIDVHGRPAKITAWKEVEKEFLGKKEKFLQIYANFPQAVPALSQELESKGLKCYEKDIVFIQRFIRDTGLWPFSPLEAEGEFISDLSLRLPLFSAHALRTLNEEEKLKLPPLPLRIISLDIETYARERAIDFEKNPILMIGLSGVDENNKENDNNEQKNENDGKNNDEKDNDKNNNNKDNDKNNNSFQKVITWKTFPNNLENLEVVENEAEMIKRFKEIMLSYQPDIITGYFTDGFDLPYLKFRADKFNIKLDLGTDFSELDASANRERKEGRIAGLLHLDMFKFVRNIFGRNLKTDGFSLDEVSFELLGHRKHEVDISELYSAWDSNSEKLADYCRYNIHDAYLALQLCHKLLPDIRELTEITGLPAFDAIRMSFSRLVESYILKRAIEYNVLAPNRPSSYEINSRREESYEGGFVFEPQPGLYENIAVFDFRSLYPSIIVSHNIGPESFRCPCCKNIKNNAVPERDDYWFCQKEKKFTPLILEELIRKRMELRKALKIVQPKEKALLEARSQALKLLGNSFYGYLGFSGARWYGFECARSTTAYARNYIKATIQKAEDAGFKVCYSDTDSCFLLLGDKKLDEALEFMKAVNKNLPGMMELEFESLYPKGIFVALKNTEKKQSEKSNKREEKGAKKKYALLDTKGQLKIRGFETVRRNWSPLAKELQEKFLNLILNGKKEEALEYLRQTVSLLKEGRMPKKKMIIKTMITREIDEYASIGPQVVVARKMLERGYPVPPGTMIEYIIVRGSNLVRDRAKLVEDVKEGEYDAEYYLNNQLIPAVSSILAVLGYNEDEIFSDSKQTGLGSYFK
ncbi:hypothetical protein HYU21_00105 [Candidatus Woesearchaeota archaeon]|nr:hypothetical protein [Candidatus Woesearchaeota archaeon]